MLALKASLLFLVGALNLLVGFLVLLRDTRDTKNRLYFLFSVCLSGWVIGIGGFLLTNSPSAAAVWAKVYYTFPLGISASIALFTRTFPVSERIPKWLWRSVIIGFLAVVLPLVFIPTFVTQSLVFHDWGKEIVINKAHYLIYSVYLLGFIVLGLVHMYRKAGRLAGTQRKQALAFAIGFTITATLGAIFNLFYPWFGNYQLIWLGPLFTNALTIAVGYSIIKYRMFDIRSYVLRAAIYLFTLLLLSALYIAPAVYIMAIVIMDFPFVTTKFIIGVAFGTIAALFFQKLKGWFDARTRRIFFHDDYDSGAFLGVLNNQLVSTIDLNTMLKQSSELIEDTIKAEYCAITLNEDSSTEARLYGTNNKKFSASAVHKIRSAVKKYPKKVIISDFIAQENRDLHSLLLSHDVSAVVKLSSTTTTNSEGVGYVCLGFKRSGNPYTNKDKNTLEAMADALTIAIQNALHFEEIQNFNLTLQQKIDDQTRELRRANTKLIALDESKDDFISMASHQLRTPLTAVKGYLSMVLEGDAGHVTPEQHKMLGQAYTSSQRMVYLIADLLNVSRLKTGKFVLEPAQVNLQHLISQEIGQLREQAASHSLDLKYEHPKDFPVLMLDETKIRQVVMNFVDNAIHYTSPGGHIKVELTETQNNIELRVIDDGIGVPRADQHKLFTKFYRAANARRQRPDGTGLGLFMAKKVILAHGGAVIFTSHEGKGSTFGFTMRKARLSLPEQTKKVLVTEAPHESHEEKH